jgi:hypothetical protein
MTGYWPGPWSCEDGGPRRLQVPDGPHNLALGPGAALEVVWRSVPAATMAVTRDPGQLYLLRHTAGDDAVSFVERIDPNTLAEVGRSPDLAGGPTWPGSLAAHANGSLYVVFGNHAHRLDPDLSVVASAALPRHRPYNGFVVLPDGHLVTKDFAGSRPGAPVRMEDRVACELVVLEPEELRIVDRCTLAEPSIARLSAWGDEVFVVGDTSLLRVRWDGRLHPDEQAPVRYRTVEGQTYGWDCVIALGAAWFLDDGEGSEGYTGTLFGHGVSGSPLHLVRVDLADGGCTMVEVCGLPGGLIANPPVIDVDRSIAVGYDSGNAVMSAFDVAADGTLSPRWQRHQHHGGHLLLVPDTGALVTGDFDQERGADQVVVVDIATGDELVRADTGSPVQSVLFPTAGFGNDLYLCTFTTVTRVSVSPDRAGPT